jgi:hypothetical protein
VAGALEEKLLLFNLAENSMESSPKNWRGVEQRPSLALLRPLEAAAAPLFSLFFLHLKILGKPQKLSY